MSANEAKKISVAKAILVGHLWVTGGVFLVMAVTVLVCHAYDLLRFPVAIIVGAMLAWPWWSFTVPKWRRWALDRGADADRLQRVGALTGLVWPKGWIFEKTEIPPRKWSSMILEVAILDIGRGTNEDFEAAFREAAPIIAATPGYISHELRRCVEQPSRYILLVKWQTLEAHTVGFRQSAAYQKWRALLHHFYDPFPVVEHYDGPIASHAL